MASRLKTNGALFGAAITLIGGFEGVREYAYRDPVGIPTICFGETRGVKMGDHKTRAECDAQFRPRLIEFETAMNKCVPQTLSEALVPDLSYQSFLSLEYNIGVGAFCGSTAAKKLRVNDLVGACQSILPWNKITIAGRKITLPGLVTRRTKEYTICIQGAKNV